MGDKLNWLLLADDFAAQGDPQGMRACAKELFSLDDKDVDGPAVMAEAALYLGAYDDAAGLAEEILAKNPKCLRARLVAAGLAGVEFQLGKQLKLLRELKRDVRAELSALQRRKEESRFLLSLGDGQAAATEKERRQTAKQTQQLLNNMLRKISGWLADAAYLAGQPEEAAEALLNASQLNDNPETKADLYSKHLFMLNYRSISPSKMAAAAAKYQEFFVGLPLYDHQNAKRNPKRRLKIGYISPDFRQHAVAHFLLPFLRDYDRENFSVYCYSTGNKDKVTEKFRRLPVNWRDLSGRPPRTAARLINEDHIDILVDFSGHSQNSCLPVLAHKPAPIQMSGLGYVNTTGLGAVDYFLSDNICLPPGEKTAGFTEKIIRLPHSHLCYAPGIVHDVPPSGLTPPSVKNGHITFGSFNNFAKVTDDVLHLWRAIMDRAKDSRLVIKSKICSLPSGRQLVRDRLLGQSFDLGRVDLRPYSPDYMEEYRQIDIALDTTPYTGGLTTCEALYMGVPVVSLRGRSHGSRLGASLLDSAGLPELIAESEMDYIKKAVQLATNGAALAGFHAGLRDNLLRSPLMDSHAYMDGVETMYRRVWEDFCQN